jgi:hypothetical protein
VIDKSKREDGTFSREDFTFDKGRNVYVCPMGKPLEIDGAHSHRPDAAPGRAGALSRQ